MRARGATWLPCSNGRFQRVIRHDMVAGGTVKAASMRVDRAHRGAERSSMGSLRTLGGRLANTARDAYLLNLLLLSAA
jgi:hypothetical protein